MKFSPTLLALALAGSSAFGPTAFAQSADMSVTGKIFPGACVVNLGGGGIADLGDIRVDSLNADTTTVLAPVVLPITVACDAEVRFAFQGEDNASESSAVPYRYGLGLTSADEKIGSANLLVADVTVDGVPGFGTHSNDSGATWNESNGGGNFTLSMTDLLGFAKESAIDTGPAPIQGLQGSLKVVAEIQPTDALTTIEDIQVSGSATVNLVYL